MSELNKNKGVMLVLSSPSGAGKSSICKALLNLDKNLFLSISTTTRLKIPNEIYPTLYETFLFIFKQAGVKNIKHFKIGYVVVLLHLQILFIGTVVILDIKHVVINPNVIQRLLDSIIISTILPLNKH